MIAFILKGHGLLEWIFTKLSPVLRHWGLNFTAIVMCSVKSSLLTISEDDQISLVWPMCVAFGNNWIYHRCISLWKWFTHHYPIAKPTNLFWPWVQIVIGISANSYFFFICNADNLDFIFAFVIIQRPLIISTSWSII